MGFGGALRVNYLFFFLFSFFQYKTYGPIIWWIESKISETNEHATREKNCRLCKLKEKHIMLTTQQIKVSIISSFISSKGLVKL